MVHTTYASWGERDERGRLLPLSTRSPPKKFIKKTTPVRHSPVKGYSVQKHSPVSYTVPRSTSPSRQRDTHGRYVSPSKSALNKSTLKKHSPIHYASPSKNVPSPMKKNAPSPSSLPSEELNCKTWPGCIYSSMAADARARGLKVRHGIDSLHKVLHLAKTKYPDAYERLKKSPNAWKTNAALAKYVRDLYMEKEHYYYSPSY